MLRIVVRLHRKLNYRNIGLRVHPPQWHPGAVIQAATAVDAGRDIGSLEPCDDFRCDFRSAGRGIAHAIELLRKAAEIVNGLRSLASGKHRDRGFPVSRSDENGARGRYRRAWSRSAS